MARVFFKSMIILAMAALAFGFAPVNHINIPPINPANFAQPRENRYFPLRPGTVLFYEVQTDEGLETGVFTVTDQKRLILGVWTTVVHDREFLNGELVEDTFDWFAADKFGNVWYFGEDTREIEAGEIVSTSGSWQAGVGNARAGIVMLAHPHVGDQYMNENAPGIATDTSRVVGLNKRVSAPPNWPTVWPTWPFFWPLANVFDHCLKTRDWNPLDPGSVEWKYYAPGVGAVLEVERNEDGEFSRKRLTHMIRA